ncbi:MAG: response regulator [Myxococcales bacterium]|nr:response regulator [Myxococcales bacterium]MCB9718173.1 response regulator [Myxococcales bacterium]
MSLVLIVDDDNGARKAMQDILTEEGYHVMVAEDGQQALARIDDEPPALLVTDLELPEINGERLVGRVRERFPAMPILVITSRLVLDAEREAERLGVAGFLNKPIDLDVLLERVRTALSEG